MEPCLIEVSFVIVSHNRRDRLLRTLDILRQTTPLPDEQQETWVVDNGSTDGSADAVAAAFPRVRLIRRSDNQGVWARSLAFEHCRGRYVVLLDDDSYPDPTPGVDTVRRSIAYLDAHRDVAAVGGRCVLPDGRFEACALPGVMLSGAVCIRRSALQKVGGFRREFFRKAGEYDLSFRLWQAGYRVERFEDLIYRHDKVATGRDAAFAFRMDIRNNLILVERFMPRSHRAVYRHDYLQRYGAFARHEGHQDTMCMAIAEARSWAERERRGGRQTLSPVLCETLFDWGRQTRLIGDWAAEQRVRRVVIADFHKNLYATFRGAKRCGLEVLGIAENHPALVGLSYRGVPVRPDREAIDSRADGLILSNVSPALVERRIEQLQRLWAGPLLTLWSPRTLAAARTLRRRELVA